jgi:hypothetical protein
MPGTKKLVARFGERLVCVRYLYDPQTRRRLKTVELVIDKRELRTAVRTAGGIWRPRQRLWELSWEAVRVLGFEGRVVDPTRAG